MSMTWLDIFDASDEARRIVLDGTTLVLGRSGEVNVVIVDPKVSRRHATIHLDEAGRWCVRDLGSNNGTRVNDTKITGEHSLVHGETIQVGNCSLRFGEEGTGSGREVTNPDLFVKLKGDDEAGRQIAWSDFYSRYAPIITGYARKLGARGDEAEDIVQEVMTGFFNATPRFSYDPAKGRFRGYLKVAAIRAIQALVAGKKIHSISLDALQQDVAQVDTRWDEVWDRERLAYALAATRTHYQNNPTFKAFERFAVLGESAQSVAQDLGLSVDGVYQAKARVTAAMRQRIEQMEKEDG